MMASNESATTHTALIINSCEKFHKKTIPLIIESAFSAGIPKNQIYVVVGECQEADEHAAPLNTISVTHLGFNIVYVPYVNIDYNAIIYFTQTEAGWKELNKYTHFFYIHDTCEFYPYFWEIINIEAPKCHSYIKLKKDSSKNIGLVHVEWFAKHKKDLFQYYINLDKGLLMHYKNGHFPNHDEIRARFQGLPPHLNEDSLFDFDETFKPKGHYFFNEKEVYEYNFIYGGKIRMVARYETPGITKYQANWGQNDDWDWNIEL